MSLRSNLNFSKDKMAVAGPFSAVGESYWFLTFVRIWNGGKDFTDLDFSKYPKV